MFESGKMHFKHIMQINQNNRALPIEFMQLIKILPIIKSCIFTPCLVVFNET